MSNFIAREAMRLNLDACEYFWYASDWLIQRCYNGVGNEALPKQVRDVLTKLTSFFGDIPFMIHDFEYQFMKPKNGKNFHKSNRNLRNNLKKILDSKLPPCKVKPKWYEIWYWYKWWHRRKRLFYLSMIKLIYDAVEEFGYGAFMKNEVRNGLKN